MAIYVYFCETVDNFLIIVFQVDFILNHTKKFIMQGNFKKSLILLSRK